MMNDKKEFLSAELNDMDLKNVSGGYEAKNGKYTFAKKDCFRYNGGIIEVQDACTAVAADKMITVRQYAQGSYNEWQMPAGDIGKLKFIGNDLA